MAEQDQLLFEIVTTIRDQASQGAQLFTKVLQSMEGVLQRLERSTGLQNVERQVQAVNQAIAGVRTDKLTEIGVGAAKAAAELSKVRSESALAAEALRQVGMDPKAVEQAQLLARTRKQMTDAAREDVANAQRLVVLEQARLTTAERVNRAMQAVNNRAIGISVPGIQGAQNPAVFLAQQQQQLAQVQREINEITARQAAAGRLGAYGTPLFGGPLQTPGPSAPFQPATFMGQQAFLPFDQPGGMQGPPEEPGGAGGGRGGGGAGGGRSPWGHRGMFGQQSPLRAGFRIAAPLLSTIAPGAGQVGFAALEGAQFASLLTGVGGLGIGGAIGVGAGLAGTLLVLRQYVATANEAAKAQADFNLALKSMDVGPIEQRLVAAVRSLEEYGERSKSIAGGIVNAFADAWTQFQKNLGMDVRFPEEEVERLRKQFNEIFAKFEAPKIRLEMQSDLNETLGKVLDYQAQQAKSAEQLTATFGEQNAQLEKGLELTQQIARLELQRKIETARTYQQDGRVAVLQQQLQLLDRRSAIEQELARAEQARAQDQALLQMQEREYNLAKNRLAVERERINLRQAELNFIKSGVDVESLGPEDRVMLVRREFEIRRQQAQQSQRELGELENFTKRISQDFIPVKDVTRLKSELAEVMRAIAQLGETAASSVEKSMARMEEAAKGVKSSLESASLYMAEVSTSFVPGVGAALRGYYRDRKGSARSTEEVEAAEAADKQPGMWGRMLETLGLSTPAIAQTWQAPTPGLTSQRAGERAEQRAGERVALGGGERSVQRDDRVSGAQPELAGKQTQTEIDRLQADRAVQASREAEERRRGEMTLLELMRQRLEVMNQIHALAATGDERMAAEASRAAAEQEVQFAQKRLDLLVQQGAQIQKERDVATDKRVQENLDLQIRANIYQQQVAAVAVSRQELDLARQQLVLDQAGTAEMERRHSLRERARAIRREELAIEKTPDQAAQEIYEDQRKALGDAAARAQRQRDIIRDAEEELYKAAPGSKEEAAQAARIRLAEKALEDAILVVRQTRLGLTRAEADIITSKLDKEQRSLQIEQQRINLQQEQITRAAVTGRITGREEGVAREDVLLRQIEAQERAVRALGEAWQEAVSQDKGELADRLAIQMGQAAGEAERLKTQLVIISQLNAERFEFAEGIRRGLRNLAEEAESWGASMTQLVGQVGNSAGNAFASAFESIVTGSFDKLKQLPAQLGQEFLRAVSQMMGRAIVGSMARMLEESFFNNNPRGRPASFFEQAASAARGGGGEGEGGLSRIVSSLFGTRPTGRGTIDVTDSDAGRLAELEANGFAILRQGEKAWAVPFNPGESGETVAGVTTGSGTFDFLRTIFGVGGGGGGVEAELDQIPGTVSGTLGDVWRSMGGGGAGGGGGGAGAVGDQGFVRTLLNTPVQDLFSGVFGGPSSPSSTLSLPRGTSGGVTLSDQLRTDVQPLYAGGEFATQDYGYAGTEVGLNEAATQDFAIEGGTGAFGAAGTAGAGLTVGQALGAAGGVLTFAMLAYGVANPDPYAKPTTESIVYSALGGAVAGAVAGAAIGSVVPGIGTAVGLIAGALIGGGLGGAGAAKGGGVTIARERNDKRRRQAQQVLKDIADAIDSGLDQEDAASKSVAGYTVGGILMSIAAHNQAGSFNQAGIGSWGPDPIAARTIQILTAFGYTPQEVHVGMNNNTVEMVVNWGNPDPDSKKARTMPGEGVQRAKDLLDAFNHKRSNIWIKGTRRETLAAGIGQATTPSGRTVGSGNRVTVETIVPLEAARQLAGQELDVIGQSIDDLTDDQIQQLLLRLVDVDRDRDIGIIRIETDYGSYVSIGTLGGDPAKRTNGGRTATETLSAPTGMASLTDWWNPSSPYYNQATVDRFKAATGQDPTVFGPSFA